MIRCVAEKPAGTHNVDTSLTSGLDGTDPTTVNVFVLNKGSLPESTGTTLLLECFTVGSLCSSFSCHHAHTP